MFEYGVRKHKLIRKGKKQEFVSDTWVVPECVVGFCQVKVNTSVELKSLPKMCRCSLTASFSLNSPPPSFHSSINSLPGRGRGTAGGAEFSEGTVSVLLTGPGP